MIKFKGADTFKEKINIEVQWATEPVIAAIERNGGVITTTYYDLQCVFAAIDPIRYFRKGRLTYVYLNNINSYTYIFQQVNLFLADCFLLLIA